MKRVDASPNGVIIFEGLTIEYEPSLEIGCLLEISGIPREQPSHVIRVFLNDKTITADASMERPSFAAEYLTYNSPQPKAQEVRAFEGAPFAKEQDDYQIAIDISEAMAGHGKDGRVDIAMTMTGLDGSPLPTKEIEFSRISVVKRSRE